MKQLHFLLMWVVALGLVLPGCQDDDPIPMTQANGTLKVPDILQGADLSALNVEFENINTSIVVSATPENGKFSVNLEDGIYTISVSGEVETQTTVKKEKDTEGNSFVKVYKVQGLKENVSVTDGNVNLELEVYLVNPQSSWVFKELYFTGSRTPEGRSYYKDKYFELYNNSDEVLYADGLSLCESDHITAFDVNKHANLMDEFAVVATIYTIPGAGQDYPVQPGKSIVLADAGINHQEVNVNSFDLTIADFEWYDNHRLDVDVPEVPNLVRNFSYSKTIWVPHNRGFKSYLIFRSEVKMEQYLEDYKLVYPNASGTADLTRYKVPNEWVLDAVECSTPSDYASKAWSPQLDASFINCGDGDEVRYGKCVRRKVEKTTEDGRIIYKDYNNSADDFYSTVVPQPGVIQ